MTITIQAHQDPRSPEKAILANSTEIEAWFRQEWLNSPAPVTSSVDLRHSGYKLASVDANLFPAGFNNLDPSTYPLCVQAAQSVLQQFAPRCNKMLIIGENHDRNQFYQQSLNLLQDLFQKAGFEVRLAKLDPTNPEQQLTRNGNRLCTQDFDPCLIVLNNDLSSGIPDLLQGVEQPIFPDPRLGWAQRLKSVHFSHYQEVCEAFAALIQIDPWLISAFFDQAEQVDFMQQEGLDQLAEKAEALLVKIRAKYREYGITEKPFLAIKADNGTYGMSVMMISEPEQLLQMNRKQRTKMASSKGSQRVTKLILQEGVYSIEKTQAEAVAEPVVYMLGQYVVGGFYRVHADKGHDQNLNAPGMHFVPLAFRETCNMPNKACNSHSFQNRFYSYGVIARLAALASAREAKYLSEQRA